MSVDSDLAMRRMNQWRSQQPFTTDSRFSQRVALDGISEAEFLHFLGEPAESVRKRFFAPPSWLVALLNAFSTIPPANALPWVAFGLTFLEHLLSDWKALHTAFEIETNPGVLVEVNGAPRRLTSGTLPEIYPRFTPDGNWVTYFTWSSQADRIWKVPRTGGVPVAVTPERDDDDQYGDVSPDGRLIAFARTERDITRVYIAPMGGGESTLLTKSPSTVPRWSPDGRRIAFSPVRTYDGGIFIISPDGSGERRLTETGGWPVWSTDGKRISYLVVGSDGNQQVRSVAVENPSSNEIVSVQFNGTNHPIDLFSKSLLVTTNSVHLGSEVWMLSSGPRQN